MANKEGLENVHVKKKNELWLFSESQTHKNVMGGPQGTN